MRSSVLRFFIVLAALLRLPAGIHVLAAPAAPPPGTWQVLGAARDLPTLYRPMGLAVAAGGNVYVADAGNFRVVEIGSHGQLLAHFGEADLRPGPGAAAPAGGQEAMGPRSLAVDAGGTVYVADSSNHYIRVFSPQHYLVGDWSISVPGATVLQMAVTIGPRGNVIVAVAARVNCSVPLGPSYCATYYVVQRRSPSGAILGQFQSTIGPSGQTASPPVINQIAVAVDARGAIYIVTDGVTACYKSCPSFHALIKHAPDGTVLAQWGTQELDSSAGWAALAIGGRGNLFLADDFNHRVEKRTSGGRVTARWSVGTIFPTILTGPSGVAVDRNGSVYVSDPGAGRVLKLSSSGRLLTQWGAGGTQTGRFWFPGSLAVDARGRLWVDDMANSRLQVLGADGRFGLQFAVAHAGPSMALDHAGNVYLGQIMNHRVFISKFSPTGEVLARRGGLHLADLPSGIAVAPNGDVYVAGAFFLGSDPSSLALNGEDILRLDRNGRQLGLTHITDGVTGSSIAVDAQGNSYTAFGMPTRFEKRSPDGVLLASWGDPKPVFDSPSPSGITLDAAGNIYVANTAQSVIDKFGPDGTLLGTWGFHGSYPGQFHHPGGIALGPAGAMYVADTDNHRIQKLVR